MPDRRRFAAGVPPLLALLAALLLGWSVAAAQAPDPLTLTITAERAECTAGTLNPVTWEIRGGVGPYRLTLDGASVDPDAESATVTCGTLPEPAPGGTPLTEAPGTIPGTVTDATGARVEASAAYTIVEPLPAPTGLSLGGVLQHQVTFLWDAVDGAGSQSPVVREDGVDGFEKYLFRYRAAAAEATAPYELIEPLWYSLAEVRPDPLDADLKPITTGDYLGMVAAIRHPIEQETPAALHWSAPVPFGVARAPQNIVVQTTHDTVDVFWDEQPYAHASVRLGREGGVSLWRSRWEITTTAGRHHARFRHLTPETEYEIEIEVGADVLRAPISSTTTARTSAAPADWEPLPKGPQNLRATATHDSITLHWDLPFPEAPPYWFVGVTIIIEGREWEVQRESTGTPPPEGLTLRGGFQPIRPNTTYHVLVRHDGFDASGAEISVTTPAAPAPARSAPPLSLTLTAERAECTAGTLNPVTWTITGGTAPYTLTVAGEPVDPDADSANATCGTLADYGIWLPVTQAPGTITAVVTDATGAPATASAAYTIVPPLPAPANFQAGVHPGFVYSRWETVRGAGSQFPEFDASQLTPAERDTRGLEGYLVRYRTDAASAWTYAEPSDAEWTRGAGYLRPWDTPPPGTFYTASVAAARHPLELETPEALNWGAPIRYTTSGPTQNLTVRATHNTVTVSWSKQPGTKQVYATLYSPGGGVERRYVAEGDEPGTHTVAFDHLEPNSEYTIWITRNLGEVRGAVSRSFRTAAAPPDWQPLPRGPQNLQATATHDTITVTWDPPFEGASPRWSAAMLDGEIMVHTFKTNDGTTTWVSSGEVDSIGRYRIRPDTTYTIIVRHEGLYLVKQTMTVTTQATPAAQSTGPVETCIEITPGWRICWTPAPAPG